MVGSVRRWKSGRLRHFTYALSKFYWRKNALTRFLFWGIFNTLLTIVLVYVFTAGLRGAILVGGAIGYLTATALAYVISRYLVFSAEDNGLSFLRFMFLQSLVALANGVLLEALNAAFELELGIAQLISSGALAILNYLMQKYWVFRP